MPISYINGKFAPPDDKSLLIVGQDLSAVAGYTAEVWAAPSGVNTYTNISEDGRDSEQILHGSPELFEILQCDW